LLTSIKACIFEMRLNSRNLNLNLGVRKQVATMVSLLNKHRLLLPVKTLIFEFSFVIALFSYQTFLVYFEQLLY
jgi:hypothetical protein